MPDGRVQTAAADHARTCPALRLARLVAELETLRDVLHAAGEQNIAEAGRYRSDSSYAGYLGGLGNARMSLADGLDRLIKETNR